MFNPPPPAPPLPYSLTIWEKKYKLAFEMSRQISLTRPPPPHPSHSNRDSAAPEYR
jgi:hypothetical protein